MRSGTNMQKKESAERKMSKIKTKKHGVCVGGEGMAEEVGFEGLFK